MFKPKFLDFELSPYTGLTRESWIDACEYLLGGIFNNIKTFDDLVIMPRKESVVSYPKLNADEKVKKVQRRAEIFEGLARSFFVATPLIMERENLELNNINIREYYKKHVLDICTRGHINSVGCYDELVAEVEGDKVSCCFQQTVETAALVICLWNTKSEIWDKYTKEEQKIITDFLDGYAHGNTVPQNWRMFNMLALAFLHNVGCEIDRDIMREHGQAILSYYVGDGWYRDGHSFDYYSTWAFNLYAPIWCDWYGYENEPYLAKKFEENSNKLMGNYPEFFDRDGFTNMWGRSNIYRNATTSAFAGNCFLKNSLVDYGLARRISSGALLQFFNREDFLAEGVPTLGFYGQFTPLVQHYSCAESPLWLGKAFICLALPKEHDFWTTRENNGVWETLSNSGINETALDGAGLCYTNHQSNGETVLRTGKVLKNKGDTHGMWNYSKLCYNTKYPWEASPCEEVEAQQYVLKDGTHGGIEKANITFWSGESDDKVLYRKQIFDFDLYKERHWANRLYLADFPVASGVIRVDKLTLFRRPATVTLGSYGFPDNNTIIEFKEKGNYKAVVLKGYDYCGNEKQMAMTVFDGWDSIDIIKSTGTNPDSEKSIVIYGKLGRVKQFGYEPYILVSQVITKNSHVDFSENEIFSVLSVEYSDPENCGGYGEVKVYTADNGLKVIDFDGIEGKLSL